MAIIGNTCLFFKNQLFYFCTLYYRTLKLFELIEAHKLRLIQTASSITILENKANKCSVFIKKVRFVLQAYNVSFFFSQLSTEYPQTIAGLDWVHTHSWGRTIEHSGYWLLVLLAHLYQTSLVCRMGQMHVRCYWLGA